MSAKLSKRQALLRVFAERDGQALSNHAVFDLVGAADTLERLAVHKGMSRLVDEGCLRLVAKGTRQVTEYGLLSAWAVPTRKTREEILVKQRARDAARRAAKNIPPRPPRTPPPAEPVLVCGCEVTSRVATAGAVRVPKNIEKTVPDVCSKLVRERHSFINSMFRPAPVRDGRGAGL